MLNNKQQNKTMTAVTDHKKENVLQNNFRWAM